MAGLVALAFSVSACDRTVTESTVVEDDNQWFPVGAVESHGAAGGRAVRAVDVFGAPPGYKSGSRADELAEAKSQILQKFAADPEATEFVRKMLETDDAGAVVSTRDAKTSELFAKVAEIRAYDAAADRREQSRLLARKQPASIGLVLVDGGSASDPVIIRRKRLAARQNVIVLNSANATEDAVVTAIAILTKMRQDLGDAIPQDQQFRVPTNAAPKGLKKLRQSAKIILAKLKAAPVRSTKEFGDARTSTAVLPAVKRRM